MSQRTIYIIIGLVAIVIFVLLYQKSQNDKIKLEQQQLLLAQNQNTQFGGNQGWLGLVNTFLGGLGAGIGSNVSGGGKPKEEV